MKLLSMTAVALVVATVFVVCFVLPAEFRIDPTGIGTATGVIRLAGPKPLSAAEAAALDAAVEEANADGAPVGGAPSANDAAEGTPVTEATLPSGTRFYPSGYRSDFVDIPLAVAGSAERAEELEYKVHMKKGATITYSWQVDGIANPEEFYYDFHGESPDKTVVEYRQATGTQSHGTLVAPFDGVFGWYLQNQSEKPVVVRLKVSGFYDLVPPGEYGNEAGIEANKALAKR